MTIINESGLYSLILSSKLLDAKKFKRWVTSEVLPSIRKTGSYGNMTQIEMIAMIASNAVKLEKKQLELENKMNEQNDLLNETVDAIDTTTKSVKKIENAFENVKEAIVLDRKEWRKETKSVIMKIAKYLPDEFENSSSVYYKLYKLLEKRAGVNLNTRLKNMKDRMRKAGVSSTKVCKANKLDVIAEDPKLIEIFVGIVKELAMKTGLNLHIDF